MKNHNVLVGKIEEKTAIVGIVGIGYVGSALGILTANAGFKTIGFDISKKRVDEASLTKNPNFRGTLNMSELKRCDIICICVPTPIHENLKPDLRKLRSATKTVAKYLKDNQIIIIESTVSVGTTRKIIYPILRKRNGKSHNFFLAFSPERVDPGNKKYTVLNTPKLVSGLDNDALLLAKKFYSKTGITVVPVSSVETAEMTKLFENVFRFVNINLVNEIQNYTNALGIDMWEVIEAASTKPYGFLPHYPGPGIGGHCIAVDPYYLLNDAKKHKVDLNLLIQASRINEEQPKKIVDKALEILKKMKIKKTKKVLIVGVSYKSDVNDIRESPALKIWRLLEKNEISVSFYDPHVKQINNVSSINLTELALLEFDLIVIVTAHESINYKYIIDVKKPILDTRKTLKHYENIKHVYFL